MSKVILHFPGKQTVWCDPKKFPAEALIASAINAGASFWVEEVV